MVRSTLAEHSGSIAGGRKRGVDPRPEQRQPLDGLVAEHEANVTIGDFAAPAAHRGRSYFLLEQTIRELDAVEPELGDVEEKRPAAGRGNRRLAL
jgi:hypothetical protein